MSNNPKGQCTVAKHEDRLPQRPNILTIAQELLDRIYSFLPISILDIIQIGPHNYHRAQTEDAKECLELYLSLSQTCQKLRNVILPLFWTRNTFSIYHGHDSIERPYMVLQHLRYVQHLTLHSDPGLLPLPYREPCLLVLRVRKQQDGFDAGLQTVEVMTGRRTTVDIREDSQSSWPFVVRRFPRLETEDRITGLTHYALVRVIVILRHADCLNSDVIEHMLAAFLMLQFQVFQ